jgi:hypothetical protein
MIVLPLTLYPDDFDVAKDRTITQPDQGSSALARDGAPLLGAIHNDILKLQVDGDYTKKFLGELQVDMRDMRERMTRLEVTVGHLPNKGFIVGVVTTTLLIGGGIASGHF